MTPQQRNTWWIMIDERYKYLTLGCRGKRTDEDLVLLASRLIGVTCHIVNISAILRHKQNESFIPPIARG
jgi:hypothetical protein